MEIKIVTTKKKLTKSLVKQMPDGMTFDVLSKCHVLGFITGIKKNYIILVQYDGEYYTVDNNWKELNKTALTRRTGQFSRKWGHMYSKKEFKDESSYYALYEAYQNVMNKAGTHIYI